MLISSGLAMLILFGLLFYGIWKYQSDSDSVDIQHRTLTPDVPVEPIADNHISDAMAQHAEYVQQNVPLNVNNPVYHTPQPQPAQAHQTPQPMVEPPEPFVERSEILDVENPIVQPAPQPMDVDIPERSVPPVAEHDSPYGVRHASKSPGRVLRDKRYRRNSG